jgi:hypothetical protein
MTVNIALTSRVIFSLCAFSLLQGPWQYLFIGQQGSATWFFIWSLKLKWPPATLRPFSLMLQYFVDHSGVDSPLYTSNIICFSFDALVMGDYNYDLRLKHPWPPPGFCISFIGVALWATCSIHKLVEGLKCLLLWFAVQLKNLVNLSSSTISAAWGQAAFQGEGNVSYMGHLLLLEGHGP